MNLIQTLEKEQVAKLSAGKDIPDFEPGDTVLVNVKVVEGERTRVQAYEGVCIGRSGRGLNENFTVRKISYGEGVERVFPLYSPMIDSIKIVRRGKVRRAKLYYLRARRGKKARISEVQSHHGEAETAEGRRRISGVVARSYFKGRVRPAFFFVAQGSVRSRGIDTLSRASLRLKPQLLYGFHEFRTAEYRTAPSCCRTMRACRGGSLAR